MWALIAILVAALGYWVYEQGLFSSSLDVAQSMTGGGGGTKLSAQQIAGYASGAGFTGADLDTAVAIALAESGGNPNAYNPETQVNTPPNLGSYGLWQIYLKAHPEYSGSNLYDPATNAAAAYAIYEKNYFSAWSTYNSGLYASYLSTAQEGTASYG